MIKKVFYIFVNRIYFFFHKIGNPDPFSDAIVISALIIFIVLLSLDMAFHFNGSSGVVYPVKSSFIFLLLFIIIYYYFLNKVKLEVINLEITNKIRANILTIAFFLLGLIFFILSGNMNKEKIARRKNVSNTYMENKGSLEEDFRNWLKRK